MVERGALNFWLFGRADIRRWWLSGCLGYECTSLFSALVDLRKFHGTMNDSSHWIDCLAQTCSTYFSNKCIYPHRCPLLWAFSCWRYQKSGLLSLVYCCCEGTQSNCSTQAGVSIVNIAVWVEFCTDHVITQFDHFPFSLVSRIAD